jgi:hypothetical protein
MGMFDGKSKTIGEFLDALPAGKREVADEVVTWTRNIRQRCTLADADASSWSGFSQQHNRAIRS